MRNAKKHNEFTYRGMTVSEDAEQEVIFEWARMMEGRYPALAMLVHIPNEGKRSAAYGAQLKRMGMKRGFPDMLLAVARGGYHGLFVELKSANGKPSEPQILWKDRLNEEGYKAVIAYGAGEAIEVITNYLEKKE